jgi:hypothetical protein
MVGKPSPQNPSISRLTLPPETITSCYPETRLSEFQPNFGRHLAESLRDCLRQRRSTMIRNAGSVDLVLLSKSGWRNLD